MRWYWMGFIIPFCLQACSAIRADVQEYRKTYEAGFVHNPRSPLDSSDIRYLDYFPPSRKAVINARFTQTPDAEPFEMPTYSGVTRTYRKYGVAQFSWENDLVSLALYENMTYLQNPLYKDYLFLPFKDGTNGEMTYGGGRYLNASKEDAADGWITIDFNQCYNPWCAYSDGFNCPIPPAENHLPFELRAGEKKYRGPYKEVKE